MRRTPVSSSLAALVSIAALGTLATPAPGGAHGPTSFELLGQGAVAGDLRVEGLPVGGLSGLAFDAAAGRYLAISDDRSERGPARFYRLAIELVDGQPVARVDAATTLLGPDGAAFPRRGIDPEGIALGHGRVYIGSEGEARVGQAPFVAEFDLEGRLLRELPLPDRYRPAAGAAIGVRDNLGFEALALSPDGRFLFSGGENGLAQESAAAAPGVPSLSRLLRWDLERGGAPAEFLYRVEAVSVTPPSPTDFLVNGLVELIALDAERLLALERQWVPGVGMEIKLYGVSLAGLPDVSGIDAPASHALAAASKTLLLDFAHLGLPLDNFEGMAFGPPLPDGRRTLFVVSDDNFNPDLQKTYLLAFAVGFEPLSIAAVQGAGHRSPLAGRWVAGIEGVVTATEDSARSKGFWMESAAPDDDRATSEGLYAAWEGGFSLRPGERVVAGGKVEERASPESALPVTTLRIVSLAKVDVPSGSPGLRSPVKLIDGLRVPAQIDDDGLARFEPEADAIDFWESLESMRVEVPAGTVIGATRSFGDLVLLPDGANLAGGNRTGAGGLKLDSGDGLPERFILSRRIAGRMPDFQVGDRIPAAFHAIVDYAFSGYRLQLLAAPEAPPGGRSCSDGAARSGDPGQLTLATFNIENFSVANAGERIAKLGKTVAGALGAPAIVALEEVQDDSGPVDDGVVTARATLEALLAAIALAGGPLYEAVEIPPENNRDGGQPGGNIRVALLFDPARIELVRRGSARPNDAVEIIGREPTMSLSLSPGRLAPASGAFDLRSGEGVRKTLVAEFRFAGEPVFVLVNHWTSKWDDDRAFGARQPPRAGTAAKRLAQAKVVREFVDRMLAASPGARIAVVGDLNEPDDAPAVRLLQAPPLTNLPLAIEEGDRYSFNFEGNSELIDHVVVSPALAAGAVAEVVHLNTNCPDSLRVSDHDPIVVRLPVH
jgi:hypothetical protein